MADNALTKISALLGDHGPDMPRTNPDVDAAIGFIRRLQDRAPRSTERRGDHSGITLTPGVSAFDHSGYVTMAWGEESGQLTISEARVHGLAMIETAEAAEMDAAIFAFAMARLGADLPQAAAMLKELREFRHAAGRART